jgi:hypothetical protein
MDRDLLESEGAKRFCLAFVDMIITWNCVEDEARNLLLSTSKGGIGSYAAVLSLGNVALSNAILAEAEYLEQPARELLEHFVECMDRQRAFRNHYVHNIALLGRSMDGQHAGAMLIRTEAKPFLRHVQHAIDMERITEFAEQLEALRLYASRLNRMLRFKYLGVAAEGDPALESWPEKPPLPERLTKPRTRPPWLRPQLEA